MSHGRGEAATAADAADPTLRGLTCAVPFEDVWQASLRLAGGGLRRWTVLGSDDHAGVIRAAARRITGATYEVEIRISLDENAQTRVDAASRAHQPGRDFGTAARLLRHFMRSLDAALKRMPRRGIPSRS